MTFILCENLALISTSLTWQLRLITSAVALGGGLSVHQVRGALWYVTSDSVVAAALLLDVVGCPRIQVQQRNTIFTPSPLVCDTPSTP